MTDLSHDHTSPRPLHPLLPWAVVALWATVSFVLARNGAFVEPADSPPLRLLAAILVPVVLFLAAYAAFDAVRRWVASLDLALVVGVQTFRVLGIVFLFLWGLGELPATFALPAGVGDVAVGVFALVVTLAVARRTPGWEGKVRLLAIVGILDFVLAFGTAALSGEGRPLHFDGAPLPVMMQSLPMAAIPTFGVGLFLILHAIALLRLRGLRD